MKRRTKKDYAPHIEDETPHPCAVEGCPNPGLYKAPLGRDRLHEYRYLCLDHIREFNKAWDYFSGMNEDEIEAFRKDAVTGHRPTWERGQTLPPGATEKLYQAVNEFMHSGRKRTRDHPRLPPKLKKALTLFELDYPYTEPELKNRYKQLVKQYHPDRNAGDKLAEEKFKAVAEAYKILGAHLQE